MLTYDISIWTPFGKRLVGLVASDALRAVLWAAVLGCIVAAHRLSTLEAFGLLPLGIGAFLLARARGYAAYAGWPVALAALLAVMYLRVTSSNVRQHDEGGHREYIEHVAAHGTLPKVQQGWETWQPPLYYYLAVGWRWLFSWAYYSDPFRTVQFLGACLYLATVVMALVAFARLGLNGIEASAGLAFLAFAPGHLFLREPLAETWLAAFIESSTN